MKIKIAYAMLVPILFYMIFSFSSFISGKTLSGKELSFDNGFYLLDSNYGGEKVNEFIMLTCTHCVNTLPELISFFDKNKIDNQRIHPYYNEKQKKTSIFFYLLEMDTDNNTLINFISYFRNLGYKTASDITDQELYYFYETNRKATAPRLSEDVFKLIVSGKKNSTFLDKANSARLKADEISLKATPAILIRNKITSFSLFDKNTDMLEAIKKEYFSLP